MKKRTVFVVLFTILILAGAILLVVFAINVGEKHNLTHVAMTDAMCTENGNIEYWICSDCGKYFSEAEAITEISQSDTVILATGHTFSANWSSDETYHWHACLNCGEGKDKAEHSWEDGVCSVCEMPKPSVGLTYTLNSDQTAYSVTEIGTCTDTDVVIPSAYHGLPVTAIGDSAFGGCTSLISVTIPDSVTSIGSFAFSSCISLTSITIPDSVTSIGSFVFYYCTSLTGIKIPDGVTAIGDSAFFDCTALTDIKIPDGVTAIGDFAFGGCTALIDIKIPDGVTAIGDSAFGGCSSLTGVTIGNGVTAIGSSAFFDCTSLISVTIGNGVTSIESAAFGNCTSLESIAIPDGVTAIGDSAFFDCTSLTGVTIGNGVTSIGSAAFRGCTSLISVTFEHKSGWQVFPSGVATEGTAIASDALADPSAAAAYLTSTYDNYYWECS